MEICLVKLEFLAGNNKFPLLEHFFPDFLDQFHGRILRVGSPTGVLFVIELYKENGKYHFKRGVHKDVMEALEKKMNFTMEIIPASGGGGTGTILPNGTWTFNFVLRVGTTADVYYERIDLAVSTGQVYKRNEIIGFSKFYTAWAFIFVIKKEPPALTWTALFSPLDKIIWILLILVLLLSILILIIFSRISNINITDENGALKNQIGIWKILELVLGTVFEQDKSISKISIHRLFYTFFLIFTLIISTAYKSKLITFLAFRTSPPGPLTFDELVSQKEYKWGLEKSGIRGAPHLALQTSQHPTFKKISKEMSLETNSVQCFQKIKFACLSYGAVVNYVFNMNFSSKSRRNPFIISKDAIITPHVAGLAWEKRPVFQTNFDKHLSLLFDSGLTMEKWLKDDYERLRNKRILWEKETGQKPLLSEEIFDNAGPKKLSYQNFSGFYNIFAILIFLSILNFFIEKSQFWEKKFIKK